VQNGHVCRDGSGRTPRPRKIAKAGQCALNHGLVGLAARQQRSRGECARGGHGVAVPHRRGSNHGEAKQRRRERAPSEGRLHGHPEGPEADAQDRLRHEKIGKHAPLLAELFQERRMMGTARARVGAGHDGVPSGRARAATGDGEREGAGEAADERGEAAAADQGGARGAAVGGGARGVVAVGGGAAGPAVQGGGAGRAVGGHGPRHARRAAGARGAAARRGPRGGVPRPRGAGVAGGAAGRRRARLRRRRRRRRGRVHVRVQAAELVRLNASALESGVQS
jgi:hypothetical protein